MNRALKIIFLLVFVSGLLGAASYLGARFKAGELLGPQAPVGNLSWSFSFKGIEALPDAPRGWVFEWGNNRLGVRSVRIYVSATGKILGTEPQNLEARLRAFRDARQQ